MPGVTVAYVARKHGTTRRQIYDWLKQLRKGNLVVPEPKHNRNAVSKTSCRGASSRRQASQLRLLSAKGLQW